MKSLPDVVAPLSADVCPACDGLETDSLDEDEVDDGLFQRLCCACGATWDAVFQLVYLSNMSAPDEAEDETE